MTEQNSAHTSRYAGVIKEMSAAEESTLDERGVPVRMGRQYRRTHVKTEGYRAEDHTVELTLTSEEPVDRYFGSEVLSHKKGAIRTTRLKNGISLLFNHDIDQLLGRSTSYDAPDGGPLSLRFKFGPSVLAEEKEGEVAAEVLKDTSGGYQVYEWEITEDKNGFRTYLAVDWEPLEGSLVTVPADPSVGVGRGVPVKYTLRKLGENDEIVSTRKFAFDPASNRSIESETPAPIDVVDPAPEDTQRAADPTPAAPPSSATSSTTQSETQRTKPMDPITPGTPAAEVVADPAVVEQTRVAGLRKLHTDYPEQFNDRSLNHAINLGLPVDEAKRKVADAVISEAQRENVDTIGDEVFGRMNQKELGQYSLRDAYAAAINKRHAGTFTDKGATGFVLEVDKSMRKLAAERGVDGLGAGIVVPSATTRGMYLSQQSRTIASGGNAGTYTNFTVVEKELIELLRARIAVYGLGATLMNGLKGKIQMPRQSAAASSNWENEGSAGTNSDITLDDIVMSPKRLTMVNSYYRDFFAQSALAIESVLANDRYEVLRRAIDTAAISGSGTAPVPLGLLNQSGLAAVLSGTTRASNGTVTAGSGGVPMTFVDFNAMEASIATGNGDIGTLRWLTTPKVRAAGRSTPQIPGTASGFVFPNSKVGPAGLQEGPLGYDALCTAAAYLTGFTANSVSNLHAVILGVWDQLLIGDWGLGEVIVDDITGAAQAQVNIIEHGFYDINVRHIPSFCACTSALPS